MSSSIWLLFQGALVFRPSRKIIRAVLLCVIVFLVIGGLHFLGFQPQAKPELPPDEVDRSEFAYAQYATDEPYLCNSLMIFTSLKAHNVNADLLLMYPDTFNLSEDTRPGRLLAIAKSLGVKLQPVPVQRFEGGDSTWAESFTKLLAVNQTQYKRVLHWDSDATVLDSMDELFLLPPSPVAMPRAYWLEGHNLSSQLILIEPSAREFERILVAFQHRGPGDYDMEIVNKLYGDNCIILAHRAYDLLSGMLYGREGDHARYLGSQAEAWDVERVLDQAKYLHFSDWPVPKPWLPQTDELMEAQAPKCNVSGTPNDCRDREKWLWLYCDFHSRRQQVCPD
ncbi:hypothetical protein LTR86_007908 [Recurvomyces mirabilis]|nr:hypothetical protein LTR86_007908 [Recurvomyces mirabilis]